ncbi:MAG: peptide deformylase [Oscillospiraceae bacterium]|nr:peptide deformylase [Oscillospiraceae bacterium]
MIKPICKDTELLSKPAERATNADLQIARDLAETLSANRARCVGMAANMIGVPKQIIAVLLPGVPEPIVMLNPRIIAKIGQYETKEGCLSLPGERAAVRYQTITVRYLDLAMHQQRKVFAGFAAQIIQHEIDHCAGILI